MHVHVLQENTFSLAPLSGGMLKQVYIGSLDKLSSLSVKQPVVWHNFIPNDARGIALTLLRPDIPKREI